jgi:putative hemolysin
VIGPFVLLLILVTCVAAMTLATNAVRAASRIWLRHWVEQRLRGHGLAEAYLNQPQRLLLAAGAGAAAVMLIGGVVFTASLRDTPLELIAWLAATVICVLLFGIAVPRAVGQRWASALAPMLLPMLQAVELLLGVLLLPARGLERLLRPELAASADNADNDALQELLREGEREGVSAPGEREIITGLVAFGEKTLRDVLTPRAHVFSLDAALVPEMQARQIAAAGYSRVPVFSGTPDNVIGMVHVRDVLVTEGDRHLPLRAIAYASPDRRCSDQLFSMLQLRQHMTMVRDDSGVLLGLVTLEDLLEEVVGDIDDEHDEAPDMTA